MERTKGKLFYQEKSDAYTHIIRPESNAGTILCHLRQDSSGKVEANAKHIVFCWNSHEKGGLVDELVGALEAMLSSPVIDGASAHIRDCAKQIGTENPIQLACKALIKAKQAKSGA